MDPFVQNVKIIQYLLLDAFRILPEDSNRESSNMTSLESGVDYFILDTARA